MAFVDWTLTATGYQTVTGEFVSGPQCVEATPSHLEMWRTQVADQRRDKSISAWVRFVNNTSYVAFRMRVAAALDAYYEVRFQRQGADTLRTEIYSKLAAGSPVLLDQVDSAALIDDTTFFYLQARVFDFGVGDARVETYFSTDAITLVPQATFTETPNIELDNVGNWGILLQDGLRMDDVLLQEVT